MSNIHHNPDTKDLKPGLFLDRDGTIIEDVGMLKDPEQIKLFPDTISALLGLQKQYHLFIITNQPWISKGDPTTDQVDKVNNVLDKILINE